MKLGMRIEFDRKERKDYGGQDRGIFMGEEKGR
jgi:hypothetical protein